MFAKKLIIFLTMLVSIFLICGMSTAANVGDKNIPTSKSNPVQIDHGFYKWKDYKGDSYSYYWYTYAISKNKVEVTYTYKHPNKDYKGKMILVNDKYHYIKRTITGNMFLKPGTTTTIDMKMDASKYAKNILANLNRKGKIIGYLNNAPVTRKNISEQTADEIAKAYIKLKGLGIYGANTYHYKNEDPNKPYLFHITTTDQTDPNKRINYYGKILYKIGDIEVYRYGYTVSKDTVGVMYPHIIKIHVNMAAPYKQYSEDIRYNIQDNIIWNW